MKSALAASSHDMLAHACIPWRHMCHVRMESKQCIVLLGRAHLHTSEWLFMSVVRRAGMGRLKRKHDTLNRADL
jgi:hypothetical protein